MPYVDCVLALLACMSIDSPSGGEEGFIGEDFAGEDQGQPDATGKPPLALASLFILCLYAYALVYKLHKIFRW